MDMKTDSLNLVEAKLNLLKRVFEGQFVKREAIEQTRNTEWRWQLQLVIYFK